VDDSDLNMASGQSLKLWTSFALNLTFWATSGPRFWGAAAGCLVSYIICTPNPRSLHAEDNPTVRSSPSRDNFLGKHSSSKQCNLTSLCPSDKRLRRISANQCKQQLVLWVTYSVVYAFYLSPLRRFPGPKLWAISRIPSNASVLRGRNHLDILALHKQYGPILRISPNELAFNTPQAFRDIYGARAGSCFPKDRSHYEPPANGVDHLVCAVDNATHARQRRLLSHAFSEKALRDQEGLIRGYVDTLISKLRSRIRQGTFVVDLKSWMNFTTFDITGDLMFGESFGCLKDSQLHPWICLIFQSMKALAFIGAVNQFPFLKGLLKYLVPREVERVSREHFDLSAQKVDQRLESNMTRPDFMSAILQNGLSEEKGQYLESERIMSRAEIHSNGFM
jgi:hypothetical protein